MAVYCTLADLRGWLAIPDSGDDPELSFALESAEGAIDSHCGYPFTLDGSATSRVFRPTDWCVLDLAAEGSSIATAAGLSVAIDGNDDGVYETSWASTDWQLEPLNGRGHGGVAWAYTSLRAVGDYRWPTGLARPAVQITAVWGWPSVPARVRQAAIMLTVAWHQRRQTLTGRGGFDGFFASAIEDDATVSDLLAPFRHGRAIVGIG